MLFRSHEAIVARMNADLANDLGNLAQRSLSMIAKNCAAHVPAHDAFTTEDRAILDQAQNLSGKVNELMKDYALHLMLAEIWRVVAEANRYFANEEPWKKAKSDPERMQTILYVTAEVLRNIAIMAQPVIPLAASLLLDLLGQSQALRQFEHVGVAHALQSGIALPAPKPIFSRYVESEDKASQN